MSELVLQKEIIAALRKMGYVVLSTSSAAAGRPKRFVNTTRGIPDIFVSKKGWGKWLGLEVKGSKKTPVSPEQKELSDMGLVHIVYSLDDALSVLEGGGVEGYGRCAVRAERRGDVQAGRAMEGAAWLTSPE